MNFSRELTRVEYFFIISFLLIYIFYFYRVFSAARKLRTTALSSIFKFLIRSVYIAFMILALLGPNFGITETEARASGKDIFLVFDLSESMNANDVEPSRLDKAKSEALSLIDRFYSDRLGIIVFNSESYVFVPLTFDQENIKNSIRSLKTSMLPKGSTDFNPMFDLVNEKLSASSRNRGKMAVIITDGERHYNVSQTIFEKIKSNGIKLFFYGVGTLSGGKIPQNIGFKKDKEGDEVITALDVEKLSNMAKTSGGDYFILSNDQNDLQKLINSMYLVTSSSEDLNTQTVTYNKYVFFLLIALIFVGIDFLITIKVLKI